MNDVVIGYYAILVVASLISWANATKHPAVFWCAVVFTVAWIIDWLVLVGYWLVIL